MPRMRRIADRIAARLLKESRRIAGFLERHVPALLLVWAVLAIGGGLIRIGLLFQAFPRLGLNDLRPGLVAPYLMIALAPALAYFLASRSYPKDRELRQPNQTLAKLGNWQNVTWDHARAAPGYGMQGLLVSLAAGMLFSMLMRMGTYFLALPALPPRAPAWATAVFDIMTFDLVFLSFMYMVCFTMALRAAPLFPRMLVLTWCYDLLMQLVIVRYVFSAGAVPGEIIGPFQQLLGGNIRKVLISVAIWLPYLIVSARVNLTFRNRIRA
jgi:hypothetical protein